MTRKPNAIETKNSMNCGTCTLKVRCRFTNQLHFRLRSELICKYYCNPEKGCFDDSGKRRVS